MVSQTVRKLQSCKPSDEQQTGDVQTTQSIADVRAQEMSSQSDGESEMCPYNADIMTAEHLLQHCRLHDALRRDMWPERTLLRDKLYGNLEELRKTAAFVRTTGISI